MYFSVPMVIHFSLENRGIMDCRYVLSYDVDPIEYFNDGSELEYFLAIHNIEHGLVFEDDPKYGLVQYYAFSDPNYHIVDLWKEEECRIYYSLD